MAKVITLIIMVTAFVVGCVGAFVPTFNMAGFSEFLRGFAPWYIALIGSIGANSAVEKFKGEK